METIIHTKNNCQYCVKAKTFFDTHGIPYKEVYHDDTIKRNQFYRELSENVGKDIKSMPQIIFEGEYIGGFTQLVAKSADILKGKLSMLESSLTYKPFRYPWAVELAKIHEQIHWIEEEIDLSEDMADWKMVGRMTQSEKDFIVNVLRLFTQSDVAVATNYCEQFIPKIKANELRNMLMSFAAREAIHQRAYALLNDTLGLPDSEYHAFLEYSEMADKIEYASEGNPNTHRGLALCLAKSVFVEGLMLFASFAALMNFQRYGKMKGMCKVVEWSLRDETTHVEGLAKTFTTLCIEKPHFVDDGFKTEIYDIARDTVKLEDKFIDLLYRRTKIEGLTKEDMKLYIRYIADRRLLQLGMKPHFNVKKNPLDWMEWLITGTDHSNFFENRVTEYSVSGLEGKFTYKNWT